MIPEVDLDPPVAAPAPAVPSRWRATIVAAGAALGLTLAGLGIAAAQTDQPSDPSTQAPAAQAPTGQAPPPPAGGPGGPGGPGREFHGKDGFGPHGGPGMGMGIHGEFTTRAPGGGYQTLATQVGEVTAVDHDSITVKSEDGYSRTYVVDDNTLVNAGNDGIADVKTGDQVHVMAVVKDGKANAVAVQDGTQIRQSHEKWMPPPPAKPAPSSSQPSSKTTD